MCKCTWSSRRLNHKYFSQLFWQHFDTLHSLNCLGTEVKTRSDKSFCFKKVKACRILNSWMNNLKWIYWNWKSLRHCVKSVHIRSFFGPYFPVFGPEKTPYLDTFYAVRELTSFRECKSVWLTALSRRSENKLNASRKPN